MKMEPTGKRKRRAADEERRKTREQEMRYASRTKSEGTVRKGSAEIEIEIEVDAGSSCLAHSGSDDPY